MMCLLCAALSEIVVFVLCLAAARRLDEEENPRSQPGQRAFWMLLCVGNSFPIVLLLVRTQWMTERDVVLLGAAAGGLLFACLTDTQCCKVYDFVWWLVLMSGVLLMYPEPRCWPFVWGQFVCFLFLQNFLFSWFYGRADVYAFCTCGLLESVFGMGILGELLHMAGAFLLLAIVQGLRNNIGADGNLKRPVPFLPYIVLSFWITLLAHDLLR